MGRIPSGILDGVTTSFGEYDECLSIESPEYDNDKSKFYGQYCLMKPVLPLPSLDPNAKMNTYFTSKNNNESNDNNWETEILPKLILFNNITNKDLFRIGICFPSWCKPNDMQTAINKSMQH